MNISKKKGLFQFGIGRGEFDQGTFRILYYQYKEYIVPVVVILTSLVLFVMVCIPLTQKILLLPSEEEAALQRIKVLEQNAGFLSSLNEGDLDNTLILVSKALPPEKDFAGILRALSDAAAASGISLGDFSFAIGDLSQAKEGGSQLGIEMTLNVSATIASTKQFLKELAARFPLSQVGSVQVGQTTAMVNIMFYYQPFQQLQLDESKILQPLSAKEVKLIEELSKFQ